MEAVFPPTTSFKGSEASLEDVVTEQISTEPTAGAAATLREQTTIESPTVDMSESSQEPSRVATVPEASSAHTLLTTSPEQAQAQEQAQEEARANPEAAVQEPAAAEDGAPRKSGRAARPRQILELPGSGSQVASFAELVVPGQRRADDGMERSGAASPSSGERPAGRRRGAEDCGLHYPCTLLDWRKSTPVIPLVS